MMNMRNLIFIATFSVLLMACEGKKAAESGGEVAVASEKVFEVKELMDDPDGMIDQMVQVQGTVTHVCRHSGKRLHLVDLESEKMIRLEAGEKIVRFERDLEGSDIIATGILRKQVIDDSYIESLAGEGHGEQHHEGEEASEGEERAANFRAMLERSGQEEIVMYWLDGESFEEN
jgi:hypothetical protein